MKPSSQDVMSIVDDLCEAILAGEYTTLEERSLQVENLLEELDFSESDLIVLREKLVRNERLAKAACDGFRAAVSDMRENQAARSRIGIYSRSGERVSLCGDAGAAARRA